MITITNEDNMALMARYPDKYFDLAIVDPPYRDVNDPTSKMKKYSKMDLNFSKPSPEFFKELFRVSKNQIIWGGNNFIDNLYNTNCFIFWYKHQPFKNYSCGEMAWTSFNSVATCFDYPYFGSHGRDKGRFHPTQKPIALYKWLLDKYAKQGDKILDTHLGSGSIAIACHDYGFDLTAAELDKNYYDDAMKRLKQHQSQIKLF